MEWSQLFSLLIAQVSTIALIVSILGALAKIAVESFFKKTIETLKAELKSQNDLELASVKNRFERELEEERVLADRKRELFHQELITKTSERERIRSQILLWANPVLNAVISLQSRLENILEQSGYLALNSTSQQTDVNWSADYTYFSSSSTYLFAQYFCWVHLVELEFSFEAFKTEDTKERFFGAVIKVSQAFGDYPPEYDGNPPDFQVFRLQQQAIGESMILRRAGQRRCIPYSTFIQKLPDPQTDALLRPLRKFIDDIGPGQKRWERLKAVYNSVSELRAECERLLGL